MEVVRSSEVSSIENIYELRIHHRNNGDKRDQDKRLLDIAYRTNGGKQNIVYTPSNFSYGDEFLYEYRQRYEELFAYQKELWDIVIANKQSNPMVSIRAIDSLHGITNDIARIIDLAPYVAGSDSVKSKPFLSIQYRNVSEIPV